MFSRTLIGAVPSSSRPSSSSSGPAGLGRRDDTAKAVGLTTGERWITSFYGVRGIGSIFYIAYATGHADFAGSDWLWSTIALAIIVSVVVHGSTVTPAMNWLERHRTNHRRALADA